MSRRYIPKVVTANRLREGDVVYQTADNRWSGLHHDAELIEDEAHAQLRLLHAAGQKLLVVEPYRVDEQDRTRLKSTGRTFVAVDTVGAGKDEFVLIVQGSSARLTPETKNLPVDCAIIGIVDSVHVEGECVYSKEG